jgi:acyl-CoA reductase-like NAD-dependent aldehyde dehydrogenase
MTEQAGGSRISRGRPVAEQPRRVVASYSSYRDAERAVDFLSDRRFPVQRVAIVGRDLQTLEQVTGRMGYGRAALNAGATGAVLGLLFGWLFGLFN